jgi:hypothetical protein
MPSSEDDIQKNTKFLWSLIAETMEYYNTVSCQCAFPRYRQYVGIDCYDYHGSFYMSETEGFIHHSSKYFNIQNIPAANSECTSQLWECKKCKTQFSFGWSDLSIYVNRCYLKPGELKLMDVGSEPVSPVPFVVGLFGHKYPDRELFRQVSLDYFKDYLISVK